LSLNGHRLIRDFDITNSCFRLVRGFEIRGQTTNQVYYQYLRRTFFHQSVMLTLWPDDDIRNDIGLFFLRDYYPHDLILSKW